MRNVLLLFILLSLFSCSREDKTQVKIENHLVKELKIFSRQLEIDTMIKPGKRFKLDFELVNDTTIRLLVGGNNLLLKLAANDKVSIVMDAKNELSLKGGIYTTNNEYSLFKATYLKGSWSKEQSLMDTTEFSKLMNKTEKTGLQFIDKFLKEKIVSKDWAKDEELKIKYFIYGRKLAYPFMNAAYSFKKKPDVIPLFTRELLDPEMLNKAEIADYGQQVIYYLISYYAPYYFDGYENSPNPTSLSALELFDKYLTHKEVKSLASQYLLQIQLREFSVAGITPVLEYFSKNCIEGKVKQDLLEHYKLMSKLGPGQPAPEIELITIAGKKRYLSEFRGKNVYIDVWATYCGKCKAEFPYLDTIKEEFKDKNWEFLMVSLDTDIERWKKEAREYGGLDRQFIVEKGHKSKFNEDYKISFAPRYIIIDKEGKIVNYNAPFPSDRRTKRIMHQVDSNVE